ncbi:hypothetical protein ES332_D12G003100v1 [Gossypium tomentosum]|uniref:Uncharacterized protein n=1 Tax=Gossypium tomentosum TaxID=34277 RepID=A0A5D2I3N2_GOSTO|nr:hypothetical protein ES332_D12G003100v1 [Gossypium tomentosum]
MVTIIYWVHRNIEQEAFSSFDSGIGFLLLQLSLCLNLLFTGCCSVRALMFKVNGIVWYFSLLFFYLQC